MLAYQLAGEAEADKNWAEFSAARSRWVMSQRPPEVPSIGLFVLRAAPAGGRAEAVMLIEALPSPNKLGDFLGIARRFESKPYLATQEHPRKYAFMPIEFDDPRYGLSPSPE